MVFFAEYAQVVKMLGGGRVSVQCYDGVTRQGLIRGTMRRRVWINTVGEFLCQIASELAHSCIVTCMYIHVYVSAIYGIREILC